MNDEITPTTDARMHFASVKHPLSSPDGTAKGLEVPQ